MQYAKVNAFSGHRIDLDKMAFDLGVESTPIDLSGVVVVCHGLAEVHAAPTRAADKAQLTVGLIHRIEVSVPGDTV